MDAAEIRARIDHPVIDADGHLVEFLPLVRDFLDELGGESLAAGLDRLVDGPGMLRPLDVHEPTTMSAISRSGWWGVPSAQHARPGDRDDSRAVLRPARRDRPRRRGALPDARPHGDGLDDDELRCGDRAGVQPLLRRAATREYSDRLLPVAVDPHRTRPTKRSPSSTTRSVSSDCAPVLIGGLVLRSAPGHDGDRAARWVDGLGLDSPYDYDPVWQRCVELGVSPTFHSTGIGYGSRTSPIELRGQPHRQLRRREPKRCAGRSSSAACRTVPRAALRVPRRRRRVGGHALRRHPRHCEKRNRDAIAHYDPRALDRQLFAQLIAELRTGRRFATASTVRLETSCGFCRIPTKTRDASTSSRRRGITGPTTSRASSPSSTSSGVKPTTR